jgi:Mrp family chromosome partitioning ATPase
MTASGPTTLPPSSPPRREEAGAFDERPLAALLPLYAAVRAHPIVVIAITLATLLACGAWLLQRSASYEARAQILVTPLTEGQTSFVGLPIVRTAPGDPTRTVQTAASIASSPEAAERAAAGIDGVGGSEVRSAVTVKPLEDTNVIDVMATADEPELAAEMASAYAEAVLEVRREALRPLVRAAIRRTRRQLESIPDPTGTTAVELRTRLSRLESIRSGTDPTLSVAQLADVPSSPAGRPAWQLLLVAGGGGLLLGLGTAVLLRLVAPRRIESDDALFEILRLPVLARVPAPRRLRESPPPQRLPPASRSAFRLLQAQLAFRSAGPLGLEGAKPEGGTTVAVLGVSQGDGATTSAAGLTGALSQAGETVIGVDLDRSGPGLRGLLGVETERRLTSATDRSPSLAELVTPVPNQRTVGVVAADAEAARLRELVAEARKQADHVVVDAGSARTIRAALPLLRDVDQVVVVVRFGHTEPESLALTAELLGGTEVAAKAAYVILEPEGWGSQLRSSGWRSLSPT